MLHLRRNILACPHTSGTLKSKTELKAPWILVRFILYHLTHEYLTNQFSSLQSLSRVQLFAIPWIAARQASLSITNYRSSLRLTSIESVMPSSHHILGHPLLLLPPIPPSIRVFSNESTLHMRWPRYWSFSFSIIPSKEIPGLISFRMDWLKHIVVELSLPYDGTLAFFILEIETAIFQLSVQATMPILLFVC